MSKKKIDRKFRLARIWSNKELKKVAHLFHGKIINVSAGDDIDKQGDSYRNYFNGSEYWTSNYQPGSFRGFMGRPNEILIDLLDQIPKKHINEFDVVFNHTTLEHIFDVFTAFRNLCMLSKDIVIVIVPFAQVQHENEGYQDFWRFTPTCIRRMFEENSMKVIYESANNDANAATYLFFVGSKYPDKWRNQIPAYERTNEAANWIGSDLPESIINIRGLFEKLKSLIQFHSVL